MSREGQKTIACVKCLEDVCLERSVISENKFTEHFKNEHGDQIFANGTFQNVKLLPVYLDDLNRPCELPRHFKDRKDFVIAFELIFRIRFWFHQTDNKFLAAIDCFASETVVQKYVVTLEVRRDCKTVEAESRKELIPYAIDTSYSPDMWDRHVMELTQGLNRPHHRLRYPVLTIKERS